jgi:hypothetical protein
MPVFSCETESAAAKKEQRNKNNIALMHPEQLLSARKEEASR